MSKVYLNMETVAPIDPVALGDSLLAETRSVLETMVSMHVEEQCDSPLGNVPDPVWGTVSFKGKDLEGVFGICLDPEGARAMTARMLNTRPDAHLGVTKIADAIGELANVIMGNIKAHGDPAIRTAQVSLPSVVRGHVIPHELGDRTSEVFVDICVHEEHPARLMMIWGVRTCQEIR